MSDLSLAAEFPPASRDEWLALVEQTLKGADFDKRLVTRTYDGIAIQPLYAAADTEDAIAVPAPAHRPDWLIAQAHDHADPAEANKAILQDLEGGVTALVLRMADARSGPGTGVWSKSDMAVLLSDVHLDAVPVTLDAGARSVEAAALFLAHADSEGIDPAALSGSLGIDPIGALAASGDLPAPVETVLAAAAAIPASGMRRLSVATRPYHAAGCSEAQELACALATGIAYLRGLEAAGLPLPEASESIRFVLTADADVFLTIAKFRAWRVLWARALNACGIENADVACDAETASRMFAQRDPAVNMLRATAATFAAAVGGARAITVAPYTSAIGLPTGFARRIARNCQVILQEESHVAQVADAAAGSWYLESVTSDLADQAWGVFQSIEAEGGMAAALMSGDLQALIGATCDQLGRDVARRKRPVTGVSEFPNLNEKPAEIIKAVGSEPPATQDAATWDALYGLAVAGSAPRYAAGDPESCTTLAPMRLAAPFEALRDASDAYEAANGRRPGIFLARLGTPAQYTARATFARNFFEAGGIEPLGDDASEDDLEAAFSASGAAIACLCSSDDVYAERAEEAAAALKRAGATRIFLAGRPADGAEPAGVDTFIHLGCPVLETLQDVHDHLGLDKVNS